MKKPPSLCALLLSLISALAVLISCASAQEKDKPKAPEAGAPARKSEPPPILQRQTGPSQTAYEEIRKVYDALPEDMSTVKKDELDVLAAKVKLLAEDAQKFETEFASADPSELAEVRYIHAKALYLLSERYRVDIINKLRNEGAKDLVEAMQQAMKSYYSQVEGPAEAAFEALPTEHPFRSRALQLVGQASYDARDLDTAMRAYQTFIELYPKYPEIDRIFLALARVYLDLENFDVGIAVAERVQKEFYEQDSYPLAGELLWKLYHSKGDLEGMWRYVNMVDMVYPLKVGNRNLSQQSRDRIDLSLDFNGFRKGYTLFACGDFAAAIDAFKAHTSKMDAKSDLNPAAKVYRDRSAEVMKFVVNLAGKPAPKDLQLEWATDRKLSLADAKGKVLALLFRGVGDARSATLVKPLWEYVSKHSTTEMAVVCYLKHGENVVQQMEALRAELTQLGYDGPAGYDPDLPDKKLFRAFQGNVGSATLFLLDREGKLFWFMQDPRNVDAKFIVSLMERRLAGTPCKIKPPEPPAPSKDAEPKAK